jgi:phosphoglycerate kinase
VGVAEHLPAYAGFLLQREVDELSSLLNDPARPFVTILGGAKVSDKLAVVGNLISLVDTLLIGGGMANTFLLAEGVEIGASLAERELVDEARAILDQARSRGVEIVLPSDAIIAPSIDGEGRRVAIGEVPANEAIFDIGPETVASFAREIQRAATIFWNGPMGVFERPAFATGTREVARAVAQSSAKSVIGGGDSVAAVEQAGLADQIGHISTGGGASLELLEGAELPGVAAITNANRS